MSSQNFFDFGSMVPERKNIFSPPRPTVAGLSKRFGATAKSDVFPAFLVTNLLEF